MQKTLDNLTIKFCENLPLNFTLYEKKGLCKKPNKYCGYCMKKSGDLYSCNKKTSSRKLIFT